MSVERCTAAEVISAVVDPGTFVSWDPDAVTLPAGVAPDDAYAGQLSRAAERSGVTESVVTGVGQVAGRPVVVIAGEFGFLAGSVGRAAADRVVAAVQRATAEGLPVLAAPTSGGTRMQEGTPAFLRMVPVAAAVAAHRAAGLPYLVWLRDPTTGGVMATWGSLGQVCAADEGALAGFLGPRVFEAMTGEPFPPVQRAENLARVGVIDAVVGLADLRDWVARVLAVAHGAADGPPVAEAVAHLHQPSDPLDGWECVVATRSPDRPGVRDLLAAAATDVTWLSGTQTGERDDALVLALARFDGQPAVVVGSDRGVRDGAFGPAGLRTAQRGYALAAEWQVPLLTVVDTAGAEVSPAAEEGAMAGEIARSLAALSRLDTPVVSLLLGSGCGGGALALLPADAVLAASDGWITPLPPEGASAIVHRTTDRAAEFARAARITAPELFDLGVIDALVGTPQPDPADFLRDAGAAVAAALGTARPTPRRVQRFVVTAP